MNRGVRRVFVEKRQGFDIEAQGLLNDLRENLGIHGLTAVRIINRYDVAGLSDEEYEQSRKTIFSEPMVDHIYDEMLPLEEKRVFAMEYLPGQYDQRADSAAQCIQILTQNERPQILSAKIVALSGVITEEEFSRIKAYCINPVEAREASMEKPSTLQLESKEPEDVAVVEGFIDKPIEDLEKSKEIMGLAMGLEDLSFCQQYFRQEERRNPTITEIRVIDTYWSDHCRHTTFLTEIEEITFEGGHFSTLFRNALDEYLTSRKFVYEDKEKDISLMDLATIGMKELKKAGKLADLDESDEINACSIVVEANVDGRPEEWLVMFKNETHNHPTEIEPFGGAATCLGGAIRDPLSGRTYVYQAMRVTGSGDPRGRVEDTLPGKLPQRKITTGAAAGYSSYGNQIGLATGQVAEIYDEGFIAKRMEIGAVIAAAPKENVVRQKPQAGDVVILLGGRTGRDGCGGATGSSKEHTEESLLTCGAEVQKGNAPTERKIQRLFRNPKATTIIKKCNDFGAGGVSVAIGELTDGITINLDTLPKKYEGLDGTELAISESQERMAVVVGKEDVEDFIAYAHGENLEAVVVADVTDEHRMKMLWRGKPIVDLSRDFLNSNGVKQKSKVWVKMPNHKESFFQRIPQPVAEKIEDISAAWLTNLEDLNVCSQRGLVERFDSTIGAGTVLMPLGGKYQATPAECMVAKLPVLNGDTTTGTMMSFGYNPQLSRWSPFHGGFYAVIEAVAKIVATGGEHRSIRLTLQEYFEKLGKDPEKWGKPFGALLGAFYAQKKLRIPAIGGKDSMSGTFRDFHVPPTLVAFGVSVVDVHTIVSQEFKEVGSQVVWVPLRRDENELPDFERLNQTYDKITELIQSGRVLSSHTVKTGGIAGAISKMTFGNGIGMVFEEHMEVGQLFTAEYGSLVLEIKGNTDLEEIFKDVHFRLLGRTQEEKAIQVKGVKIPLEKARMAWEKPLEKVFPTKHETAGEKIEKVSYGQRNTCRPAIKMAKPRIFIPVFPGTNCEIDSARAFEKAGGIADTFIFKNLTTLDIEESIGEMEKRIRNSQIIMIPGGFSGGDEPDGSGKFIATAFRNPRIQAAVMELLYRRDGLVLGICNGFQALVKLGLLPYGEIREMDENCPTLTFNRIGRHASRMTQTRVASTLSPWFSHVNTGDIHSIPISHGEGRFVAKEKELKTMLERGQIATQYVNLAGDPTMDGDGNPNGSIYAIEGITSPDGRILGKMAHSERIGAHVGKNVPGEKDQRIFQAGVAYFRD